MLGKVRFVDEDTVAVKNLQIEGTVSADGTVTVTDGTLVAAVLDDANENEWVKFGTTVSAVNEVTITNAATGAGPTIEATGDDTNADITLKGKGTGAVILGQATSAGVKLAADQPILDSAGLELVKFVKATTAVNELTITNAATGNGPILSATGETNVPITLKGKGTGNVIIGQATSGGVQLVADQPILDSAGLELVKFVATGSAVNEITVTNQAADSAPSIAATGGDTNIDLALTSKGTGIVTVGSTGTASATAGAATCSTQRGIVTSEGLTTAQNAAYTLTVTNTKVAATDIVLAAVFNGTNTQGTPVLETVTPGAGSFVVVVRNRHATSEALNGTLKIAFAVL